MRRFALLVPLLCACACTAAPAEDDARATSEGAFTVERGDRYVVSATPDKVVLAKEIDGVAFPFTSDELRGKAVLIHPVDGKAEGGVYLRAREVEDDLDRIVVRGAPLSLPEMAEIDEDEIVRIFIDKARPEQAMTLDVTTMTGLARAASPVKGVTVAHDVEEAKLAPTPFAKWTHEAGLELGLRLDFSWRSKLAARGEQGGEIFRSKAVSTKPFIVFVPIGPAVVPITFTASAYVTCSAVVSGAFDASIGFSADATFAASVRIDDGLEAGSIPPTAKGTADVTPDFSMNERAAITCTIPRVDFRAAIAGVAGVYLAIAPVAEVSSDSVSLEADVLAGVDATVLGFTVAKETKLYSWKAL